MVAPRHFLLSMLLAAGLVGCAGSPPTATATATPIRTATPVLPTATATLAAEVREPRLIQGPENTLWAASSLTNESSNSITNLEIQLNLMNSDGRVIGEVLTTPNPPGLPVGGRADIAGRLPSDSEAAAVSAEILHYQPTGDDPITLEIMVDEVINPPAGGSRILGTIQHEGSRKLSLVGFSVVVERGGEIIALPSKTTLFRQLRPGEAVPWSADFAIAVNADQLAVTAYGLPPADDAESCQVEFEAEPGFQLDPQGNPFFTGVLQNQENGSCRAKLLLQLQRDGRPVDLFAIDSPIPLAGGEERPFGFRLRELSQTSSLEDYDLEPYLEATSSTSTETRSLSMQLTSFENLGSNLVLRGRATNTNGSSIQQAMVLGALRSTEGQLLTAGWQPLPATLEPDQSADFVLLLPISDEMDVNVAEFDVRALGLE